MTPCFLQSAVLMDWRAPRLSVRITTLRMLDNDTQKRALRIAYSSALSMEDRQFISKVSFILYVAVCKLRFLFFQPF